MVVERGYMDHNDENEIFYSDKEEEFEKENNPVRLEFNNVKASCNKVECLINMMLTALKNDFDETDKDDIIDYIELVLEQLQYHDETLDKFFNSLDIPYTKTKLIGLSYYQKKE